MQLQDFHLNFRVGTDANVLTLCTVVGHEPDARYLREAGPKRLSPVAA